MVATKYLQKKPAVVGIKCWVLNILPHRGCDEPKEGGARGVTSLSRGGCLLPSQADGTAGPAVPPLKKKLVL